MGEAGQMYSFRARSKHMDETAENYFPTVGITVIMHIILFPNAGGRKSIRAVTSVHHRCGNVKKVFDNDFVRLSKLSGGPRT